MTSGLGRGAPRQHPHVLGFLLWGEGRSRETNAISFRSRLFAGFLLASLLPLLLCSAMLLQIFRLRLDSQAEAGVPGAAGPRDKLAWTACTRAFSQTALALQASPYVAPALWPGDSGTALPSIASCTAPPRAAALSAQFDLYDRDGVLAVLHRQRPGGRR